MIETLFDAMAFFHSLDGRLVGPPAASLRWSFAEIPDTDLEVADPTSWYLARPLGLDAFELFLPSLACRDSERRTARWPPADRTLDARARQARKGLPAAPAREVLHVLMDDGQVVGYSGFTPEPHGGLSSWVERRSQVWQDVRKGYRYFVVHEDGEIDLQGAAHERVWAPLPDDRDLLADLPEPEPAFDIGRLRMFERHDDLYLQMRRDGRCSCTQCCTRCSEDPLAD